MSGFPISKECSIWSESGSFLSEGIGEFASVMENLAGRDSLYRTELKKSNETVASDSQVQKAESKGAKCGYILREKGPSRGSPGHSQPEPPTQGEREPASPRPGDGGGEGWAACLAAELGKSGLARFGGAAEAAANRTSEANYTRFLRTIIEFGGMSGVGPHTLFLALGLLSPLVRERDLQADQLLALGAAALVSAAKFEEPSLSSSLFELIPSKLRVSKQRVLSLEPEILSANGYHLLRHSPVSLVVLASKGLKINRHTFANSITALLISLHHASTFHLPCPLLALSSLPLSISHALMDKGFPFFAFQRIKETRNRIDKVKASLSRPQLECVRRNANVLCRRVYSRNNEL